jgi:hypothetical protein
MLPVYYTSTKLVKDDIIAAKNSWDIIATNACPLFLQKKNAAVTKSDFAFANCLSWFYSVYYNRLFDVHPVSRYL